MSTTVEVDDRFAAPAAKTFDPRFVGRISPAFNLALFGFSACLGLGRYLSLLSDKAAGYGVGAFLWAASWSIVLDMCRCAVVLAVTASFLQIFWRRFVASVTAIRPIDYQEALAIVLMLGILFGR